MDPGTALAVVSLSFQLLAGCVKGFVVIQGARNLGQDGMVARTRLMVQEHRLIEWAKAVNLIGTQEPIIEGLNQSLAALLLINLRDLLTSAKTLRQRYKLDIREAETEELKLVLQKDQDDTSDPTASKVLSSTVSHTDRENILKRAAMNASDVFVLKRLWWASVDKKRFSQLVDDVENLVGSLWQLLDPIQRQEGSQALTRALQTAIQMSHDIKGLYDLQTALSESKVGIPSSLQECLGASASLRAVRLKIEDIALSDGARPTDISVLEPLDFNSFRDVTVKSSNRLQSTAIFNGVPVFQEEKRVEARMKRKLKHRVLELVSLLSQPISLSFMTLTCLGYIEEVSGFRLVFQLPHLSQTSPRIPVSLLDALRTAMPISPDAGSRHRLCVSICRTLLSFHNAGWLHKDLRSENILLFSHELGPESLHKSLERPFLTGFSFARKDSPTELSEQVSEDPARDIYRHPLAQGEPTESFARYMDTYALACVLAEVLDWTPLAKIVKSKSTPDRHADLAYIRPLLVERYITRGYASFRLGRNMQDMMCLCFCVAPDGKDRPDTPSLAEFYACLTNLEAVSM